MNTSPLCRVELRHKEQPRWARLVLAFPKDEDSAEGRFLVYPGRFVCEMEGLDPLAASYTLENWESGVLSGAFYAFRRLKMPPARLVVHELRGRLGSADMPALAVAAAVGVACLAEGNIPDLVLDDWECRSEKQARTGSTESVPVAPLEDSRGGGLPSLGRVESGLAQDP